MDNEEDKIMWPDPYYDEPLTFGDKIVLAIVMVVILSIGGLIIYLII